MTHVLHVCVSDGLTWTVLQIGSMHFFSLYRKRQYTYNVQKITAEVSQIMYNILMALIVCQFYMYMYNYTIYRCYVCLSFIHYTAIATFYMKVSAYTAYPLSSADQTNI